LTFRNHAHLLTSGYTWAFVQPVLDFLALNVGAEVTQDTGQGIGVGGHLQRLAYSPDNMVKLYVKGFDDSSIMLTQRIQEVPFLWVSERFVMTVKEEEGNLPQS